jgi:hypothetical protein
MQQRHATTIPAKHLSPRSSPPNSYFFIDDALRFRSSLFLAFSSLTRLARI